MLSQWECLLKNLGKWQGSFTRYSPQGEFIEDMPTVVILEGRDHNTTVHQVVRYCPANQPPYDKITLDYKSLNKSILFFDNGAFSQGSLQWGPFSEFGAEFGLIEGDRRLRQVILFNKEGYFDRLTLIREKLPESKTQERPPLTIEQLLGEWRGKAVTIYPDFRTTETYTTHIQLELENNNKLIQKLSFATESANHTITSSATVEGSVLSFTDSKLPIQILLLPDGASCNCPLQIKLGNPFFLEIGWLLDSSKRQRLIRSYNQNGGWISSTFVEEFRS